jgi:hydroxyacylglutathione hydrolase
MPLPTHMTLLPIPAFNDNYLWLLHDGTHALVVDPGQPQVVQDALLAHGLSLAGIVVTHHHWDHTGGVAELQQHWDCEVYHPRSDPMPFLDAIPPAKRHAVAGGDTVHLLGLRLNVIDVPGHTAGHIAYVGHALPGVGNVLFCGDTLFAAGCGRLFEGTPAQMRDSLNRLGALPADTLVCCAHEYTMANLQFALAVDPKNAALVRYSERAAALRAEGLPTVPTRLSDERAINPFLRVDQADIVRQVMAQFPKTPAQADAIFGALREWKNNF